MTNWLVEQMASHVKKPMPLLSFPGAELCGFTVSELVKSGKKQAECMASVAQRVDCAASVSLMDLSVEAECFGAHTIFPSDEVPSITGALISDAAQADALEIPPIGTARSAEYIKAIELARNSITDRPILAGAIGPFSLAGRLVGVTQAMYLCYDEPDMLKTVLGKTTDFIINYIVALRDSGADGVVLAEPLSGLLSPALEAEFSAEYVRKIARAVKSESFIIIYHNCGGGTLNMSESIFSNGCDAYHFGNAVDLEAMLKKAPSDIPVFGNLDPAGQLCSGTPESVTAAVTELMRRCSPYPNFIVSSGCDVPPGAKWENIDAFFNAVKIFYAE